MKLLLLAGILATGMSAAPVFTLTPSAHLTASAGGTTGWGFDITADSQFALSILGSFLVDQSDPAFGTYTDLVGLIGGPDAGYLGAGANWTQPFVFDPDPLAALGLGWFEVAAGAQGTFTALLHLDYEVYDWIAGAPGDYISSESVELPVSITVVDTVVTPEPGTWTAALGLGLAVLRLRRR